MNPIESLRGKVEKPHYPKIMFMSLDIKEASTIQYDKTFYSQDLQKSLLQYESEKMKMGIIVTEICYNNLDKYKHNGGTISIGLNLKETRETIKDINNFTIGYCDNDIANSNKTKFTALKGMSIYDNYIFDTIIGGNVLGLYDQIYYELGEEIKVDTYTIVYKHKEGGVREITLHDFGKYGNILTKVDLHKTKEDSKI